MITVNTCGITAYSPLIPAIKAMCNASPGETLEIIMNHADAFQDLKEYLSEGKSTGSTYNTLDLLC